MAEPEWPDKTISVYYLVFSFAWLGLELRGRQNWALSHFGAAPGSRWIATCINHRFVEQSSEVSSCPNPSEAVQNRAPLNQIITEAPE